VGPGVRDAAVVGSGVAAVVAIVVSSVVGTGVAGGAAGWEHPAASARMRHKISTDVIVRIFFMPEFSTGGYLGISLNRCRWKHDFSVCTPVIPGPILELFSFEARKTSYGFSYLIKEKIPEIL
jgi:hypothetical protein